MMIWLIDMMINYWIMLVMSHWIMMLLNCRVSNWNFSVMRSCMMDRDYWDINVMFRRFCIMQRECMPIMSFNIDMTNVGVVHLNGLMVNGVVMSTHNRMHRVCFFGMMLKLCRHWCFLLCFRE